MKEFLKGIIDFIICLPMLIGMIRDESKRRQSGHIKNSERVPKGLTEWRSRRK